jgi:hypothetical protein
LRDKYWIHIPEVVDTITFEHLSKAQVARVDARQEFELEIEAEFDGYLCRGEESPLYKRNVDPTAKCPAFVRQVVTVESIVNGEESLVEPVIDGIDLDEEESEVTGKPS